MQIERAYTRARHCLEPTLARRMVGLARVLGLVMVLVLVAPPAVWGQSAPPYDLASVVDLLEGGVPEPRILVLLREDCIDFAINRSTLESVRRAGGSLMFAGELSRVCWRGGPSAAAGAANGCIDCAPRRLPAAVEAGRFGYIGATSLLGLSGPAHVPLGLELALGVGSPLLGLRGDLGFLTSLSEPRSEPGSASQVDTLVVGYAGLDLVLLPGAPVYALAGAGILSSGDVVPRAGVGLQITASSGIVWFLEARVQEGFPFLWGNPGSQPPRPSVSVSVGIGGNSFGSPGRR